MNWVEYVKGYHQGHTLPLAVMRVIVEVDRLHKEGKTVAEILQEFEENWFFASQQLKANIDAKGIQDIINTLATLTNQKSVTTLH